MWNGITIIAEVKTESPFSFKSEHPWEELFETAEQIGDIVSIHTDPRWGGNMENIAKARKMTKKPILAKGIHAKDDEIKECLENGADYVLVVGRIPFFSQNQLLIEPLTLDELRNIPLELRAVWNSRDLKDGTIKKDDFLAARDIFKGWLCQASNITTYNDINREADAVLIGESLLNFRDLASI